MSKSNEYAMFALLWSIWSSVYTGSELLQLVLGLIAVLLWIATIVTHLSEWSK